MLSQLKCMAVAAAAIFFALACSEANATHVANHATRGQGVYRAENECLQSLPAFNERLSKLGMRLTKPTECEEVLGQQDAYAPVFEATSEKPMIAEMAVAGLYEDHEACESNLKALLGAVAAENEIVVEAACVPVSVVEQESDEMKTGQFQPMVFLLRLDE